MKGRFEVEQKKMSTVTAVEIIVTYISIGWSMIMFFNSDALSLSWGVLREIASREVFGSLALVCALVKIYGIIAKSLKIRKIGLVMSSFFWLFVSVAQLFPEGYLSPSTGVICYSGISILCMFMSKELKCYDKQ